MPGSGTHRLALGDITQDKNLKGEAMLKALDSAFDVPKDIPKAKNKSKKK